MHLRNKIAFFLLVSLSLLSIHRLSGQDPNREIADDYQRSKSRRDFRIPDIPGYKTLTGDFHMHTVFSDGAVWPTTRVEEAWREGLDVIAITDHIEARLKKKHVGGDLNAAYEIARASADKYNIILVHGAEITRKMPPGHFNALFINDANKLTNDDPMLQIEEAINQDAFVLWNHPGWASQQPDTTLWWDFHTEIYEKGWLHGIEVFNSSEWYPIVLHWCMDKDLTVFANTDIHSPLDQKFDLSDPYSHRPLTLVFCNERSEEGVREALFEGRTLGWFGNTLVGKEALISKLFEASVSASFSHIATNRRGERRYHYKLNNPSDLTFFLKSKDDKGQGHRIELLPGSEANVEFGDAMDAIGVELMNCYSDSNTHPVVNIHIPDGN